MTDRSFDVIVIGAGIAGATAAAHLASERRVVLLEAEEAAGSHTTGRSAATWIPWFGPPDVQTMTAESRAFLLAPPAGFADTPLLRQRPLVRFADAAHAAAVRAEAAAAGLRELTVADLRAWVPAVRPDAAVLAVCGDDAFDIDVDALLQAYLRQVRRAGGVIALRNRADRITRRDGVWDVATSSGAAFSAPVLVNAAGAWGDAVAALAGVAPLGLQPKRRTVVVIDPAPYRVADWPLMHDGSDTWYARPEARTRLLVSLAEETDMAPHDVRPDEIDIAAAIDNMQRALAIDVRRVEHAWAGLRTFTPDRSFAIGWDAAAEGFFWSVGQGGYGIQTAPAQGRLVADLIAGRDPGPLATAAPLVDPARFSAAGYEKGCSR
jgi:D-arginine dehydrogenase